jgi:hypothetical protein
MYIPFGMNMGYFMPQSSSLSKVELAIHELIGSAVYAGLEWKLRRSEAHPGKAGAASERERQ